MRTACAIVFAGIVMVCPATVASQVVSGRVVDAASRQPIGAVTLQLLRGAELLTQTASDSAGRFLLRAPTAGRYHITASRIGYADATTQAVDITDDQTMRLELQLSAEAIKIAPLTVEAPRDPYLATTGFYERMRTGSGFYLQEADIQKRAGSTLVDLLRTMRGIKIQRVNTRQEVYLTTPNCLPQIVLDGVMVRWGGRSAGTIQPLEDLVRVPHIAAMEVYRAFAGVPTQYVGPNANCGTILVWTRHK